MVCGHRKARVKKALEYLPEVGQAVVSREADTALVSLKVEMADSALKNALEDQDYTVTAIQ